MFEHKELDGTMNRVIAGGDAFVSPEILEMREVFEAVDDVQSLSRKQYAVIDERLVERSLPPENVGERWPYDDSDAPWWTTVNNPPHAGMVASFNAAQGGKQRVPLDPAHNVVAFSSGGDEVIFKDGGYGVVRQSDGKEITAPTLVELRRLYCGDA
jgi:hypothetical protein